MCHAGSMFGTPYEEMLGVCERAVLRQLNDLKAAGVLADRAASLAYVRRCHGCFLHNVRRYPRRALSYLLLGREVGALWGIQLHVLRDLGDVR